MEVFMRRNISIFWLFMTIVISACVLVPVRPTGADNSIPPTVIPISQPLAESIPTEPIPPSSELEPQITIENLPTEIIPTPTSTDVQLSFVRVGAFPPSTWILTYDRNSWNATANLAITDLPYKLESKNIAECTISQNLGMGVPETWERKTTQETFGTYSFKVEQWTDTSIGQIVLVVYFYQDTMEIAIRTRSDANACLTAAKLVLQYSAENHFGPIKP
jgi:hypothetical protein